MTREIFRILVLNCCLVLLMALERVGGMPICSLGLTWWLFTSERSGSRWLFFSSGVFWLAVLYQLPFTLSLVLVSGVLSVRRLRSLVMMLSLALVVMGYVSPPLWSGVLVGFSLVQIMFMGMVFIRLREHRR